MQVGRVYKLVLFVLVFLIGAAIVMWGRAGDEPSTAPAVSEAAGTPVEEAAAEGELVPIESREPQELPNLDLPSEVTYDNPYFVPGATPAPSTEEDEAGESGEGELVPLDEKTAEEVTSDPEKEAKKALDSLPKAPVRYTVKSGDSLGAIAKKFYGRASKWRVIAEANGITNPAALKVGSVLTIPDLPDEKRPSASKETKTADAAPAAKEAAPRAAAGDTYTVMPGDSLWKIAKKVYGKGSLWKSIYEANRKLLPKPGALKVGMKLIVPPAPVRAAKSPAAPAVEEKESRSAAASKKAKTSRKAAWDEVEVINFFEE